MEISYWIKYTELLSFIFTMTPDPCITEKGPEQSEHLI